MKLLEVKTPVKSYLYESIFNKKEISTLTFEQLNVIEQVEDAVLPHIKEYQKRILTEAPISADRITDPKTGIFAIATRTADEKGVNPGFLQKSTKAIGQSLPIQALTAANKALNDLGAKIQDTKPVTGFDTRVEKIKLQWAKSLRKSQGGKKLLQLMTDVGTWGKENPGKQAFALGALMVVAGVMGGPGGAAASGYLLRSVMDQAKQGVTEVPTGTEVESDTGRVYTKGEDGSWTDNASGVILPKSDEGDENFEAWSSLESKARVGTGVGRASTTAGKAAKTALVGLVIGAITDAVGGIIDTMFPPEVRALFISADGTTVDLSNIEAMSATSLEELDPEQIKELYQARSAMTSIIKTKAGQLSTEDTETFREAYTAINQKIGELGGDEAVKDFAGLTGTDLDLKGTTTDMTQATDELSGVTSSTEEIVQDTTSTISAAELDGAGINFMTEKDIPPEWKEEMASWGLDNNTVDQIENSFKIEKAISDREWMGEEISAGNSIVNWSGEVPDIEVTKLGIDPTKLVSGQSFESNVSISIEGIDEPITVSSRNMIEGIDANGNPVFTMNEIFIMPDTKLPFEALDGLTEEQVDRFWDMENQFSGSFMGSKADVTEIIDTFKNKLAQGIGAVATMAAVGGALAGAEVKGAKNKEKSEESFMPDLAEDFHNAELNEDWNSVLSTVKQTSKLLGTKLAKVGSVSLDKLLKAWQKAGSPEDTEAVRMIMSDAGLDAEVIEKAITDGGGLGLEEPGEEPGADDAEAGDAKPGEEPGAEDAEAGDAKPGEEPGADDAEADDAETGAGAETGSVEATDEEIAAVVQQIVDSGMYVNGKVTHAGLKDIIGESNKELAKLIAHIEYGKENEMRVDEMCGGGCGDEMEMPKTNYNLSVTKDEGSTHKTMTVTSDQPDELIRVLQLSGMDTGHSEPDGDEIVGVDMDHDEPSSVTSMQDLIAKVSNGNGHDEEHSHGDMTHSHSGGDEDHDHDDEAHEEAIEVEQDPRHSPKTYSIKDLVVGHTKKQPRQRRVAAHHGDNPYKDAGQLEEEYVAAYDAYKNEK